MFTGEGLILLVQHRLFLQFQMKWASQHSTRNCMAFRGVLMYSSKQWVLGYPGKSPSVLYKSNVTACLLNLCFQIKGKKKRSLISEYPGGYCHLQHLSAHYRFSRYFDSKIVFYSFTSFLASSLHTQQIKHLSLHPTLRVMQLP